MAIKAAITAGEAGATPVEKIALGIASLVPTIKETGPLAIIEAIAEAV